MKRKTWEIGMAAIAIFLLTALLVGWGSVGWAATSSDWVSPDAVVDGSSSTGKAMSSSASNAYGEWVQTDSWTLAGAARALGGPVTLDIANTGSYTAGIKLTLYNGSTLVQTVVVTVGAGIRNTLTFWAGGTPGAITSIAMGLNSYGPYGSTVTVMAYELGYTAPPAPTAPAGLTTSNVSYDSATLSWSPVQDSNFSYYQLYLNGTKVGTASGTSYQYTGLAASTTYILGVSNVWSDGSESGISTLATTTHLAPDTTAPAAPTGVSVSSVMADSIALLWNANTEPDLQSYRIYENGVFVASSTTTSYRVSGLTAETNYQLGISAVDTSGNESAVTYMSATTAPLPPDTPTGLTANVSGYDVGLSWSISASAVAYQIFRDGNLVGTSTTTSYTDAGLTPGTHSYQAAAVDQYNQSSVLSAAVSAKVYDITPPAPPAGLVASASGNALDLSWAAPPDPDVASYRVYLDGVFIGSAQAPASSYTISGLALSTTYSTYVTAVDAASNESAPSNTATATTTAAPATPPVIPTGFAAQPRVGAAYLSWDPVPAATQLTLLRDGRVVATLPASTTAYTDPNLPKGPYSYSLVASNSVGSSPPASADVVISTGNIEFTMAFAGLGSQAGAFLSANLNWILVLLGLIIGLGLVRLVLDLLRRAAGGDH